MQLSGLDLLFWAASLLGHIVLLLVMWVPHRATLFPLFTTLITANILRTIALFLVLHHGSGQAYFSTYWSLAIVDVILQLSVVYELTSHVFRPLGAWASDVKGSFALLLCGSVAVASCLTLLAAPQTRFWVQAIVIQGNFFSSALMSELFVGIIALSVPTTHVTPGLAGNQHVVADPTVKILFVEVCNTKCQQKKCDEPPSEPRPADVSSVPAAGQHGGLLLNG